MNYNLKLMLLLAMTLPTINFIKANESTDTEDGFFASFTKKIKDVGTKISDGVESITDTITDGAKQLSENAKALKDKIESTENTITEGAKNLTDETKNIQTKITTTGATVTENTTETNVAKIIANAAAKAAVKSAVASTGDTITENVKNVANAIEAEIKKALEKGKTAVDVINKKAETAVQTIKDDVVEHSQEIAAIK